MEPVEITVTCATSEEALRIMRAVVEQRLAACGQTWPALTCYRWAGDLVTDEEHVVLLKSVDVHFGAVCDAIRRLHSYELPSIVMIPLEGYGPGYRDWVFEATGGPPPEVTDGGDPG